MDDNLVYFGIRIFFSDLLVIYDYDRTIISDIYYSNILMIKLGIIYDYDIFCI